MNQHLKNRQQWHLNQAIHNEAACNFLHHDSQFFDWVVNTAFYSALHYVSSVIFPLEIREEKGLHTVYTVEEYCEIVPTHNNKHRVLSELVYEHCKGIGKTYDRLLDMSFKSRYEFGCHDSSYSTTARRYLQQVQQHCHSQNVAKRA
ncbi:HEPN domain-containing protein [Chitinophaga agri]|uniref:Uncharacterized protein n=1 Tax=Chitinophaga agri TaxID=2703787 RepID=A0A6B9ZPT6_9BACT|nr:hypothetical protein [Chitinophaga agri]QHS62703.1 hypothetical protein GWR21_24915 [Chitinophaga agri]